MLACSARKTRGTLHEFYAKGCTLLVDGFEGSARDFGDLAGRDVHLEERKLIGFPGFFPGVAAAAHDEGLVETSRSRPK